MVRTQLLIFLSAAFFVGSASAQSGAWAQCGGEEWSGDTTCISGWTCVYSNPYYSQCLESGSTTETTTTAQSSSSSSTSTSSSATGTPSGTGKANYWFSFGDSYSQTQFEINGTLPDIANPIGNPPYPGYTAVGGVNWIDCMTVVNNNSLVFLYNYAYGGATINASLVTPYEPTVLSVVDQVNEFLGSVADKPATTPWTSENSIFSIWIGINDLGNSYYESGDRDAFNDVLLTNLFELVQDLYNVGARNFLFLNVPPTDRSPLMLAEGTSACELLSSVIADYNTKYISYIDWFKGNNTGVSTWLWDSNSYFDIILNNPTEYGFVDAVSYGNTGDFWGNTLHPAAPANQLFAQNISTTVLENTIW